MKKSLYLILILLIISSLATAFSLRHVEDNVLHTTVFHNRNHQTLNFLVTFGIGYGDAAHCNIVKKRIFTATHTDGFVAHNYGHYLAKEFGPELFSCVNENLHVIGSSFPDENFSYALSNNGEYYTHAYPDRTDVYPQ